MKNHHIEQNHTLNKIYVMHTTRFFFLTITLVTFHCFNTSGQSSAPNAKVSARITNLKNDVKKGFIISGTIKDLPDGTIIYLIKSNEWGNADTVIRVKSEHSSFVMTGTLKKEAEMHFVKMDTSVVKLPSKTKSWVRILLDNSHINITGNLNHWPKIILKGSVPTIEYDSINAIINDIADKANIRIKEAKEDSVKISILTKGMSTDFIKALKSFPDSYATPLVATQISLLDSKMYNDIYTTLSTKVKNSFYGDKLNKNAIQLSSSENISPGNIIPGFSILSPTGININILEEAAKNKITLIDFWASWCKPCRNEAPNLLKVYNAFHNRGFSIIGISSDENKLAWERALKEDNTPWVHGLEDVSNRIGKGIFRLQSIPAYVLIDNKGKLIAFSRGLSSIKAFGPDIRGEELYQTIDNILNDIGKDVSKK